MNDVNKANILIVDDRPQNLISLKAVLEAPHLNIVKANSGNEALSKILENEFALVLLDVQMPDMDGFETAEYIRGNKRTQHIPIIFVTAISKDKHHIFKGYESGAVDYIFKPLDPDILKNKVAIFINLYRQKKLIEMKNDELIEANKKILGQQKELIKEERLKVLLQIAGATAHELNQPLMVLLGNIELLELVKGDQQKIFELIPKIQEAGTKISETVKKIGQIRYDVTVKHDDVTQMIKLDQDVNILSVEDSDSFFGQLTSLVDDHEKLKLSRARSIEEAMVQLDRHPFDIILLDYDLPDGTGLDFIEKQNASGKEIPVVTITGKGSEQIASDMLKAGSYDYIPKTNLNINSLYRVIHATLEKFALKKEVDQSVKKMAEMSTRDQLTGLYNRRYMDQIQKREVERSKRYKTHLSCLMLDLDFFKQINDTHGHICGDGVLQEFSNLLQQNKRQSDYIFRYGGEEFVVFLPHTEMDGALTLAEKIRVQCHAKIYTFKDQRLTISVSIGVSSTSQDKLNLPEDLIKLADKALYKAKASGRNCVKTINAEKQEKT
jgi:two-component system cell cycle response regulator